MHRLFKEQQEKKQEREKRRLEKMRALGAEFLKAERKRKLKKKLRKRRRASQLTEGENDVPVVRKKKKKKKKPQRGDAVFREFSKFSSGSDGSGLEDDDDLDYDIENLLEDEEDDLFQTDHEFRYVPGE